MSVGATVGEARSVAVFTPLAASTVTVAGLVVAGTTATMEGVSLTTAVALEQAAAASIIINNPRYPNLFILHIHHNPTAVTSAPPL
jgi:hypothetical protein